VCVGCDKNTILNFKDLDICICLTLAEENQGILGKKTNSFKQTNKQTNKQASKQTSKQTNKQTANVGMTPSDCTQVWVYVTIYISGWYGKSF